MKKYSRVCARINLDTMLSNIKSIQESLEESTQIMTVLKADGYGHGALPIAKITEGEKSVWGFALATAEEALMLRRNGISKPLLILGSLFPEHYKDVIAQDIQVVIYQIEVAKELSEIAKTMHKTLSVHIKLDTGMGRLGLAIDEESIEAIVKINTLPNLRVIGLATHFAKADEADKAFTDEQIKRFLWMRDTLQKRGVVFQYHHCANSAAMLDIQHAHMDLVRIGIALHGLYPSDDVNKANVTLEPTLSLTSHVSHVKWVEAGTQISYGGTYVTKRKSRIVTVPVGYADGYPRSLSNKGMVIIQGTRLPIVGRVCMDFFMIDATALEEVHVGDKVTLIGKEKKECITVAELSTLSERFHYEFICDLSKRIPREYLSNEQIIEQIDYFG